MVWSVPKRARRLEGTVSRAVCEFVGPISSRQPAIAPCRDRANATTGPLDMNRVSFSKKGLPSCSA